MITRHFIVFALLAVSCVHVSMAGNFDQINNFLKNTYYQTTTESETYCIGSLPGCDNQVPQSILNIDILLGRTLGELFNTAKFSVTKLECDRFRLFEETVVSLTSGGDPTNEVYGNIKFNGASMRCQARGTQLRITDVDVSIPFPASLLTGIIESALNGLHNFDIQESDSYEDTIDLDMGYRIPMESGKLRDVPGMQNTIYPDFLEFTTCSLDFPNSLIVIEFIKPTGIWAWAIRLINGAINQIVFAIIKPLLCDILKQTGLLSTSPLEVGFIGQIFRVVNSLVADAALQAGDIPPPEEAEADFLASLPTGKKFEVFRDSFSYKVMDTLVNDLLGSPANETISDRLVINDLVDRISENDQGRIDFDFDSASLGNPDGNAANVVDPIGFVAGANTFEKLKLLKLRDNLDHSLRHNLFLERIVLGFGGTIQLDPKDFITRYPGSPNPLLNFKLDAGVSFTKPNIDLTTLVATESSKLNDIYIGNVLDFDYALTSSTQQSFACIGEALYDAYITEFKIEQEKFDVAVNGFIDKGFDIIIQDVTKMFNSLYSRVLQDHLGQITQGQVNTLNTNLRESFKEQVENAGENAICPNEYKAGIDEKNLLDFTSDLGKNVKEAVDGSLANVDDPVFGVNAIMDRLTAELQKETAEELGIEITPGNIYVGDVFSITVPVNDRLTKIQVGNLQIKNLNTFTKFDVLNPLDANTTRNHIGIGKPQPVLLSMDIFVDASAGDTDFKLDWTMEVEYHGLDLNIDAKIGVDLNQFYPLKIGQLTSPACIIKTIDNLGILKFSGSHELTKVDIQCDGCSLGSVLRKDRAKVKMTEITNAALALMRQSITNEDAVNGANRILQAYGDSCERGNFSIFDEIPLPTKELVTCDGNIGQDFIVFGNLIAYVMLVFVVMVLFWFRSQNAQTGSVNVKTALDINRYGPSMFLDPSIPVYIKFGVPIVSAITLVLFLSANLDDGGNVIVQVVTETDETINLGSLFTFTLTGTITDMWCAGVPWLALVVVVASGIWPYMKVVLTLVAFFLPPRVLKVTWRGKLLNVLDFVGKWSVVDQFMMALLVIVFNINVQVPSPDNPNWYLADLIPENFMEVKVRIVPDWGLYGFLLAAIVSIGVGHVVVFYHNHILDSAWQSRVEDSAKTTALASRKIALRNHQFERQLVSEEAGRIIKSGGAGLQGSNLKGYKMRYTPLVAVYVFLSFLAGGILLILGGALDTFGFNLQGVGGMAMAWLQPGDDELGLSLFKSAGGITKGAESVQETMGLLFMQITFLTFAFIVPLLRLFINIALWYTPLSLNDQKKVFRVSQALSAWSGMEVFVGSIFAAYFNIEQFAKFMVTPYCGDLDPFFKDFGVSLGLLEEDNATCFRVVPYVTDNIFIPILSVFILSLVSTLVTSSCKSSLEDRESLVKGCYSPYNVDPATGVPFRKQKSFCCHLKDVTLIQLGIVRPILVMSRNKNGAPEDTASNASFAWSGNFDAAENESQSSVPPSLKLNQIGAGQPSFNRFASGNGNFGRPNSYESGELNELETGNPMFNL